MGERNNDGEHTSRGGETSRDGDEDSDRGIKSRSMGKISANSGESV